MSEHHHEHEHDENCACGCHDAAHDHAVDDVFGEIHVESHQHDEACVVSGRLTLRGDETRVKAELQAQLGGMGKAVGALGGIVGHIKASCETTTVDIISVTDTEAMSKRSPEAVLRISLAAIVFAVEPADAEQLAVNALKKVQEAA